MFFLIRFGVVNLPLSAALAIHAKPMHHSFCRCPETILIVGSPSMASEESRLLAALVCEQMQWPLKANARHEIDSNHLEGRQEACWRVGEEDL